MTAWDAGSDGEFCKGLGGWNGRRVIGIGILGCVAWHM